MRTVMMIAAALPLMACGAVASTGSGEPAAGTGTTRAFSTKDFDTIELSGADDVAVTIGAGFSIRAEGPTEELDKLELVKDRGTLKIGRQRNSVGWNWSEGGKGVKVYVTLPRLAAAAIAGSGDMSIDRIDGGDFSGAVAGSGDLTIGALKVGVAKLSIAGSGDISASGTAQAIDVSIAGSGNVAAPRLKAAKADVSIAGSGDVEADVNGDASVSIVGSGSAMLGANARCKVSKMGSGDVRCGK